MFVPASFAQHDRAVIFELMRRHSFALLVSQLEGSLFATHMPLLVEADVQPHGRLRGHLARANPQWQELAGQEVLVVFSGPHAYVSPTWYEEQNVVPTWNYVAVHAYGKCELVDESTTQQILADYVTTYERSLPTPWQLDTESTYFTKLSQAVVGFQITITRLEAKWKLNQNHPQERRERAARHLSECDDADSKTIAELMKAWPKCAAS
jgi:transcriptional regulator